jgi:hypothetical protein
MRLFSIARTLTLTLSLKGEGINNPLSPLGRGVRGCEIEVKYCPRNL